MERPEEKAFRLRLEKQRRQELALFEDSQMAERSIAASENDPSATQVRSLNGKMIVGKGARAGRPQHPNSEDAFIAFQFLRSSNPADIRRLISSMATTVTPVAPTAQAFVKHSSGDVPKDYNLKGIRYDYEAAAVTGATKRQMESEAAIIAEELEKFRGMPCLDDKKDFARRLEIRANEFGMRRNPQTKKWVHNAKTVQMLEQSFRVAQLRENPNSVPELADNVVCVFHDKTCGGGTSRGWKQVIGDQFNEKAVESILAGQKAEAPAPRVLPAHIIHVQPSPP